MVKRSDKIINSGEPRSTLLDGENLSSFKRKDGVDDTASNVRYSYFVWLCSLVGLNGPDKSQKERTKETDSKTYFTLAWKLFDTRFKVLVQRDDNRVADGRGLRDRFALLNSKYKDYSVLDTPGASILEVLIALVERFDTEVMMTEDEIDRSKEWFWELLKNCDLDMFVDEVFKEKGPEMTEKMKGIIEVVNSRGYASDGKGGFLPLKHPKCDQRNVELWIQIHSYFLENHIE